MAPFNPDLDDDAPALQPATITLRLESADLGINLAMLLPAEAKGRVPFQKLLAQLMTSGIVGPAFDVGLEAELERFEAATQRNDTLRWERHNFYTRIETHFKEMTETIKNMKRDYYREIDNLREQLSRKRRNPDFEPEDVVFFHPDSYKLPSWEEIVGLLDDMRMKRDLLQKELGGDRIRLVPVSMLCRSCRSKFLTPEEQLAAYMEEHRHQAVQCVDPLDMEEEQLGALDAHGGCRALDMSVQTDWVPVLQQLGHKDPPETAPQISGEHVEMEHAPVGALQKDMIGLAPAHQEHQSEVEETAEPSMAEESSAGADPDCCMQSKPYFENLGDESVPENRQCNQGPPLANKEPSSDDRQGAEAEMQEVRPAFVSRSVSAMSLDIGDAGDGDGNNGKLQAHVQTDHAGTQTNPHWFTSSDMPASANESTDNATLPDMVLRLTVDVDGSSDADQKLDAANRLGETLERIFAKDPLNNQRRALKRLRQKTMTQKQRDAARITRQLAAIKRHVERQAFARWKGAVAGGSWAADPAGRSGMHQDMWRQESGPPMCGTDVGGLVGRTRPQHLGACRDDRSRLPRKSSLGRAPQASPSVSRDDQSRLPSRPPLGQAQQASPNASRHDRRRLPSKSALGQAQQASPTVARGSHAQQAMPWETRFAVANRNLSPSPSKSPEDLISRRPARLHSAPGLGSPSRSSVAFPREKLTSPNHWNHGADRSKSAMQEPFLVSRIGPRSFPGESGGAGVTLLTRVAHQRQLGTQGLGKSASAGGLTLPKLVDRPPR